MTRSRMLKCKWGDNGAHLKRVEALTLCGVSKLKQESSGYSSINALARNRAKSA